jgi:hypothetical protein
MAARLLQLLRLLCLAACCCAAPAGAGVGSRSSCSISADWTLNITGRSGRDFEAVLPAPYCLFFSASEGDIIRGDWSYYAVDFVTGSLAWQWNCTVLEVGGQCGLDMELQDRGGVVPSLTAGRVYVSTYHENAKHQPTCDVMYALDATTGRELYSDGLCSPLLYTGDTLLLSFPLSALPAGQELVVHGAALINDVVMLHVLNASSGAVVSSVNVTGVGPALAELIDGGRAGLFFMQSTSNAAPCYNIRCVDVFELRPDGSVRLAAANVTTLLEILQSNQPQLPSQPALNLDNPVSPQSVIATDVLTNSTRWSSADPFLVGAGWGNNGSFAHFSTEFRQLLAYPDLFVVLNTAAGPDTSVMAAAAVYSLASGKQLSLTPTFAFSNLTGYGENPNMWELQGDNALVLRADDRWLVLDLPSLSVRTAGQYATWDAASRSNNWIVSDDGSYVALPYDSQQGVQGFKARQSYVRPAVSSWSSSAAAAFSSSSSAVPPTPEPSSSSSFGPLEIGLLCVVIALLLALLLVGIVWRRRSASALPAGQNGSSGDSKREGLLSSHDASRETWARG